MLESIDNAITKFDGDAKEVLAIAAREIKIFDTANEKEDEFKEKGKDTCKDILHWLYLVSKNMIDAIQNLNCSKRIF